MTSFGNSTGSFPTGAACVNFSLDLVVGRLVVGTYAGAQLLIRAGLGKVFHGRFSVDWHMDGSLLGAHVFAGDIPVMVVALQHSLHGSDSTGVAVLICPGSSGRTGRRSPAGTTRIIHPSVVMGRNRSSWL